MGAFTAHNIYCRYDNHGHCGYLDCSVNHFHYQVIFLCFKRFSCFFFHFLSIKIFQIQSNMQTVYFFNLWVKLFKETEHEILLHVGIV